MRDVASRLAELGIVLPAPAIPVANYLPCVLSGNILFVSGQLPIKDGKLLYSGRLGQNLDLEEGKDAARVALINSLAVASARLGGLDHVKKVVRLAGFVACTEDFLEHPAVVNGASDLLVEIFSESGRHARIAVGVSSLPLSAAVELEVAFEVNM